MAEASRTHFTLKSSSIPVDAAPILNGVPLVGVTSLSLQADALGVPKLILEMDIVNGLDLDLLADVKIVKRFRRPLGPRRRYRAWQAKRRFLAAQKGN